jgi:hypothetical protein
MDEKKDFQNKILNLSELQKRRNTILKRMTYRFPNVLLFPPKCPYVEDAPKPISKFQLNLDVD